MCPRPYQLGKRQALIDASRRKVLDAARALLAESTTYTAFTVDAVAKRADVARATVYYQFGSKTGLIEALCDALASDAGFGPEGLAPVFAETDERAALRLLIERVAGFWAADRRVMRRLRALAALDVEVGAVIAERDERLRTALKVLLKRTPHDVEIVHTLIRFETLDALAGTERDPRDVAPTISALVEAALKLSSQDRDGPRPHTRESESRTSSVSKRPPAELKGQRAPSPRPSRG